MDILIDGHKIAIQPEDISWEPPEVIARDGAYAPVRGQYWKCRLSIGKPTAPLYHDWQDYYTMILAPGINTHAVWLPHPFSQVFTLYTCYIDSFSVRINTQDCAIPNGVDIELSRLLVL